MKEFPEPQVVKAGDMRLATYQQGEGPPVILVHGWPEIAYSWKNQMGALATAGYRAIAPDLKGFGRSDAPKDKAQYDIRHMTDDLARLLDALSIEKAIFCGHDWGGAIVWPMAQLHADRVAGVISICTPHRPRPPVPPLSIIEKRFGPKHYFIQFQEEAVPEALFEKDIERFFRLMFRLPASGADMERLGARLFDLPGRFRDGPPPDRAAQILSDADLSVYIDAYRHSGFTGGINLYRNVDRNYEIMRDMDPTISQPALMISAEKDFFLPPESADGIEKIVPNVERALVRDCGHWVMWEKPAELNALMIDWLDRRYNSLKI